MAQSSTTSTTEQGVRETGKDNGSAVFNPKGFIITAILLFVILMINAGMVFITYINTNKIYTTTSREMNLINSANGQLEQINTHILEIAAGVGGSGDEVLNGHFNAINALFADLSRKLDSYEEISDHNEMALRRFTYARKCIEAYCNKISQNQQRISSLSGEQREQFLKQFPSIYQQEIAPLQLTSAEMMVAAISIGASNANRRTSSSIRFLFIIMLAILAILIAGEYGVYLFARSTKRSMEEIAHKTRQVSEVSRRLVRSRERMENIAETNILTGMKNRYALEQDMAERLATDSFNMAVFDIDNFRTVNDTYGYDFGDELLAQISERLRKDFSDQAEIYNITGNEFCFIFDRDVTETEAASLIDRIITVFAAPYTISNLTVQMTVSGATYHYLAGDCLNVNSLLVKVDNVLRNAKRAGGAQILQVINI